MKYLEKYHELNISENEVFDYLMRTLRELIITWGFFTDFEKVKNSLKSYEVPLAILNTLIGKEDIEQEFVKIVKGYPEVRRVLPLLIALRTENLRKLNVITNLETLETENMIELFNSAEPVTGSMMERLVFFFVKSGLRDFLASKRLKNIVDYCYGVEVGLDSNARKNRTGTIMEQIVEKLLLNQFGDRNRYSIIRQASASAIKNQFGFAINFGRNEVGKERKIDFVIINKTSSQIFAIETNAYTGGGSKLKSTAGEYTSLHELISRQPNVKFIWITDGLGWHTARAPLKEAFEKIDYLFNLKMVEDGFLKPIIS
jgi:type II restriction enzyme